MRLKTTSIFIAFCLLIVGFTSVCAQEKTVDSEIEVLVLGVAQDAGAPQINCKKRCCKENAIHHQVVSLGIVVDERRYLIEATPDIGAQLKFFEQTRPFIHPFLDGIFVTHAHIGHYTGLMYLGKEAMNALRTPTFLMPRMFDFIEKNGPWSQLVSNENIDLRKLQHDRPQELSGGLKVTPILVPHRDEFSETVGYLIEGTEKSLLFIPDIDKWEKWDTPIVELVSKVDYALLDATFYDAKEINHRDISTIPHPFVVESFSTFDQLPQEEKAKIHFIHFNHTNPLLDTSSEATRTTLQKGYKIAEKGMRFKL